MRHALCMVGSCAEGLVLFMTIALPIGSWVLGHCLDYPERKASLVNTIAALRSNVWPLEMV